MMGSFMARPAPTAGPLPSPFKQAVAATKNPNTPARVVTLPAGMWAHTWQARQTEDAKVGLRRYSETDAYEARAAAAQKAWKLHPQDDDDDARLEAYNGALMAIIVGRATCDPEDVTIPFFGSHDGVAVDIVPLALAPRGIEHLFEEIEVMVSESPTNPEATDEDLAWLSTALASGKTWGNMNADTVRRIKRLLGRCIDELRGSED